MLENPVDTSGAWELFALFAADNLSAAVARGTLLEANDSFFDVIEISINVDVDGCNARETATTSLVDCSARWGRVGLLVEIGDGATVWLPTLAIKDNDCSTGVGTAEVLMNFTLGDPFVDAEVPSPSMVDCCALVGSGIALADAKGV